MGVAAAAQVEPGGKPPVLAYFDVETYCDRDIRDGGDNYARECEVLMLALQIPDEARAYFWDISAGPVPAEILDILEDPGYLLVAWNIQFERAVLRHAWNLELPAWRWLDAMVLARACSLPGGLDQVGRILGLPQDVAKMKAGKALIQYFCNPRKPSKNKPWARNMPHHDPQRWAAFCEYCRRDVDAMVAVFDRLPRHLVHNELDLWTLDIEINDRGLPIDVDLVRGGYALIQMYLAQRTAELAQLTGLSNPGSRAQLLPWLKFNGYPFDSVAADVLETALGHPGPNEACRAAIRLRLSTSQSSVKKYATLVNHVSPDGRLRGSFRLCGAARTGRWTGAGFQPQNLPRPTVSDEEADLAVELLRRGMVEEAAAMHASPMDAAVTCVRAVIKAEPGKRLVVADLNAIESRVLGYLCQEPAILDVFADNLDPYKVFAADMFGVAYDQVTKEQRTVAKPAVLGCGYLLGGPGLREYAADMGVELTEQEALDAKDAWRRSHPQVVAYWRTLEHAFMATIRDKKPRQVGVLHLSATPRHIAMRLPSGRHLIYADAAVEMQPKPWGEMGAAIVYSGVVDQKNQSRGWQRISTHPGKLVENAVQAIARDVLADGLRRANAGGLTIVGHVHDEIICEEPEARADQALRHLVRYMTAPLTWAPDLPLAAAGYVSERYRKD